MTDERTNRAKGRLKLSNIKLNTLLEITDAINNNSSREDLFAILRHVLKEELHIGKFVLFSFDPRWRISLIEGYSKKEASKVNINEIIENYTKIDVISGSESKELKPFDIVIPVYHKQQPLAYLLLADMDGEKIEISPIIKHLRFIQTLANIIVVAMENKRLAKEEIDQIAVKKELELAQNMQSLLFPRQLPNDKNLKVKAYYQPHSQVGGDYYDVIPIDENRTALCIADVSGKGISAALLMANFQANLRALIQVNDSLEELVKATNQKVIESANFEKFITFFIAIFDVRNKKLSFLNAGHQPAILCKKDQNILLKKGCTVLGMFEELPIIEMDEVEIESGDKLFCFTDGLTELENEEGIQIEVEGIAEIINHKSKLEDIVSKLEAKIKALKLTSSLEDDITFLAAEFLR
jgi:sigma-B regulation protein RsbU (phosphoserine phosphatase)